MSVGTVTYPSTQTAWGKDTRGLSSRVQFTYAGPSGGGGGYATGGDPIDPGQVKLGTFEYSPPALGIYGAEIAVIYQLNCVNNKMQAFWCPDGGPGSLVEVDAGADLSGYIAQIVVEGRG